MQVILARREDVSDEEYSNLHVLGTDFNIDPIEHTLDPETGELLKDGHHRMRKFARFSASMLALDLATDKIVEAFGSKETALAEVCVREAVHRVVARGEHYVSYDDMVKLTAVGDCPGSTEPTWFPMHGSAMPELQREPTRGPTRLAPHYIAYDDVKSAEHVDGSSLSPAALSWRSEYVSPLLQPANADNKVHVTRGVNTAVGILSGAGAVTPWHVEQRSLGSANVHAAGQIGKVWYLGPPDFCDRVKQYADVGVGLGGDPTHLMFTKSLFYHWITRPLLMQQLGIRRIYQPPGWTVFTMPVSACMTCADLSCWARSMYMKPTLSLYSLALVTVHDEDIHNHCYV